MKCFVDPPDRRLEFLRGYRAVPAQTLEAALTDVFKEGSRRLAFSAVRAGLRPGSRPALAP